MKVLTTFVFVCSCIVPVISSGDDCTIEVVQPAGGDPAPAANPPIIELRIAGGHLREGSIRLSIDRMEANFDPSFDGIDNDSDGLIDETGEEIMSYPASNQTRMLARWPWSLTSDDPATPHVNEGLHVLTVTVSPTAGQILEETVRMTIHEHGGLDSLLVYPSPFNPGEERARIAFRTLTEGLIKIEVFDFQGRSVLRITDWTERFPGWHQEPADLWDGKDEDGNVVGNGVYFVRVSFKNGTLTEESIEKCFVLQ